MEGTTNQSETAPVAPGQGDTARAAPVQGDIVQPAPGQGDTTQPAPVISQPAPDAKGPIPYDRFEEVNKQAKEARDQVAVLQSQLMQTQGMLTQFARVQQPQVNPPVPADPLSGISDSDLLDPQKVRQAILRVREDAIGEANKLVAQVQFQTQYPDFNQLVGYRDGMSGQFVPSEIMAEAIRQDPQLPTKIQQSGNPQVFAYEIARLHKELRAVRAQVPPPPTPTPPAPAPNPLSPGTLTMAQQIRAAQQVPQSISAATGTGALDKTSHVQNMTNEQFGTAWVNLLAGKGFVT